MPARARAKLVMRLGFAGASRVGPGALHAVHFPLCIVAQGRCEWQCHYVSAQNQYVYALPAETRENPVKPRY